MPVARMYIDIRSTLAAPVEQALAAIENTALTSVEHSPDGMWRFHFTFEASDDADLAERQRAMNNAVFALMHPVLSSGPGKQAEATP